MTTRTSKLGYLLTVAVASIVSSEQLAAQIMPPDAIAKRIAQARPERKPDQSDDFFRSAAIPLLKIEIPKAELDFLRQNNRQYVRAKIVENDKIEYHSVGIKLKGAAGSFRGIDDRPSLTLNFNKFRDKQRFHDLDKIHLNNSVQDPSYLNELVCSELFLAAGIPTPRTFHARVWLNGRDLGLYVLKEGFDKRLLARHFKDATGNLYDGGFVQDIDGTLQKDSGDGPDDRSDIRALVEAAREGDPVKRWQRLEETLAIDQFLTFMALELMCSHWDGYCNNRNNYRLYFDATTRRAQLFPHGMDQMFGDPNANALQTPGAMIPQAVLSNPEWRGRYRDRLAELLPLFSPPDKLHQRIDEAHARIRPALAAISEGHARDHDNHARRLKELVSARAKSLEQQNNVPEPRPLKFSAEGVASVVGWKPKLETADAKAEEVNRPGEPVVYAIASGPSSRTVASWRAKVLLTAGKYKLRGKVRTVGVSAVDDASGSGAGLRISGGRRTNKLAGDSDWQTLEHEFDVASATQEVELVAELRATKGAAHFDAASLVVVRSGK